jgi:hypothetical protein
VNPREKRLREAADKVGALSDGLLKSDVALERSRGHDLAMTRISLLAEADHVGALEDQTKALDKIAHVLESFARLQGMEFAEGDE